MTSYLYLGRDYDYHDSYRLNEARHYCEIFNDFIEDIVNTKEKYIDNDIFTGWYYNMRDYNVNKDKLGVKLNLCITDKNMSKRLGYINPYRFPEITIYINKKLINNIPKFKSILLHEITHVIKIYIKNRNGLTTNKESIMGELMTYAHEFDIPVKPGGAYEYISTVLNTIFYILADNEQLATINEACKYAESLSKDNVHTYLRNMLNNALNDKYYNKPDKYTIFGKDAQVYNFLNYIKDTHFLSQLLYVTSVFDKYKLYIKLLVGYYLNKHGYIKPKLKYINYDIVYSAIHSSNMNISNNVKNEITNNIYNSILKIYEKYKKKLYDAMYIIMEKHDFFLPNEEIIQLAKENEITLYDNNLSS